ncbi:MAG: T9SS type A sorting domain-containing protein [Chitinophagales bacterium]|nr:T9SS type A sorting domain-containing protein [Chitinophagales bacterium]
MKNASLLFLLFILSSFIVNAQVPNTGFESWTNNDPTGWWSTDQFIDLGGCKSTTDAHSGSNAVILSPISAPGLPVLAASALSLTNLETNGIAYNQRPESFSFWSKYSVVGGDVVMAVATLTNKKGDIIGVAGGAYDNQVEEYTHLTFPFTYNSEETPDSLQIIFFVGIPDELSANSLESYLIIDDISLNGSSTNEIPNAPSELIGSLTGEDNQNVLLRWADKSDNEDNFIVERKQLTGRGAADFVQIATIDANFEEFLDNTVEGGQTYHYQIKAQNSKGISPSSNVIEITVPTPTRIKDTFADNIDIFPNPASKYLNINFPIVMNNAQLNIYNSLGAVVAHQSINGKATFIQFDFPAGLYILKVQGSEHAQFSKPFIVK